MVVLPSLLSVLIAGVLLGALYAGMAVGFSLMFGVLGILNLTYGQQLVLGAFVTFWLAVKFDYPFVPSALAGLLVVLVLSYVVYKYLITRMLEAPIFNQIVITFGALIVAENLFSLVFGTGQRTYQSPFLLENFVIFGASVTTVRVVVAAISVLMVVGLYLFLTRTNYGKSIYATAINEEASKVCGIDVERVKRDSFLIGSGLAAISGSLMILVQPFGPFSGLDILITLLIVVILGGLGSIIGTLIGGIILGLIEVTLGFFIPGAMTPVIAFTALIIVLVVRPAGIMGIEGLNEV